MTGYKAPCDLDLLLLVDDLPALDPISRKQVYKPKGPNDPKRPDPSVAPRVTFQKSGEMDEHYLYVEKIGDFTIDWNVATLRQYERWEQKIPENAKVRIL